MKSNRFRQSYRNNASSLHKKIGDVLRDSIFKNYRVMQEYPLNKINPDYKNGRCKFDWVILDLAIIIEGHGEQHDRPVNFGGMTDEEAEDNFFNQKYRDNLKMNAALEAGYTYIVIPYSDIDKIDEEYIWQLYKKHISDKKKINNSDKREEIREFNREQYKKYKEYKRSKENETS
jgi:hypothetical protein